MLYLQSYEWIYEHLQWFYFILAAILAALLIRGPRSSRFALVIASRTLGGLITGLLGIVAVVAWFFSGFLQTERYPSRSPDGSHVALLVHEEDRDTAGSRVLVKRGCCRHGTAYEYWGQDSDYMDAKSLSWADNYHLVIRYAVDKSGQQHCYSAVGDVQVLCEPQATPTFPSSTQQASHAGE